MPTWLDEYGMTPAKYAVPPRAGQTSVASVDPWAAPAAPPPNPAVTLSPGYTPDYRSLLESDPAYLAWKNNGQLDMNTGCRAAQGSLAGARRRLRRARWWR